MKGKHQVKIILLCFVGMLFLQHSFSQDTIHWTPGYKLQWKDFKGKPDASSTYSALTTSGVTFSYRFSDTSFRYTVVSAFHKQLSWRKKLVDSLLLAHEQGHFDITEIHARRLRKQLNELKPRRETVRDEIQKIVKKIIQESKEMEALYDKETSHSRNVNAQREWQERIMKELEPL